MTDEQEHGIDSFSSTHRTHTATKVAVSVTYDHITLDIGMDRFFMHAEMALEIAELLKKAAATLHPPMEG